MLAQMFWEAKRKVKVFDSGHINPKLVTPEGKY